jgi:DNA-binding transcriptional regulator YhcF (GntR family)
MVAAASAFEIDRDDELPVGVQLAWRIRTMIANGELAQGDRVPGVRELADRAGVNVNTARAVYGRLEQEGLLSLRHGLGTFVTDRPVGWEEVERIAAAALENAARSGIDPREVARAIYTGGFASRDLEGLGEGTGLPDVGRAADEAAARRELRRQINRIEAQLASYPEARSARERHPLLRPKAHVADLAELEEVRNELMNRLKEARAAAEQRGERQSRARGRRERMIGDPERHRWERVANDEIGDPGCGDARAVPRFGPIGAVAGWWRVKVSSGCP